MVCGRTRRIVLAGCHDAEVHTVEDPLGLHVLAAQEAVALDRPVRHLRCHAIKRAQLQEGESHKM